MREYISTCSFTCPKNLSLGFRAVAHWLHLLFMITMSKDLPAAEIPLDVLHMALRYHVHRMDRLKAVLLLKDLYLVRVRLDRPRRLSSPLFSGSPCPPVLGGA
jgi:hypothetical protein